MWPADEGQATDDTKTESVNGLEKNTDGGSSDNIRVDGLGQVQRMRGGQPPVGRNGEELLLIGNRTGNRQRQPGRETDVRERAVPVCQVACIQKIRNANGKNKRFKKTFFVFGVLDFLGGGQMQI